MVEPLTTGAALVGVGGWFANKLLGPSADALGDQLRVYAGMRLNKILGRAEEISEGNEPKALPPAFSMIALQRASLSEDEETVTEMWARLLLSASNEFENLHMIFVDVLSQMGAKEAQFLNSFRPQDPDIFYQNQVEGYRKYQSKIDMLYGDVPDSRHTSEAISLSILNSDLDFIGSLFSVVINYITTERIMMSTGVSRVGGKHMQMLDTLGRQRIVDFKFFKPANSPFPDRIEAVALTPLGNSFLHVCSKDNLSI
mgnify:CR=1 FL=1